MTQMDPKNPIDHFHEWFEDAKKSEPSLPEAMSVAT
ncbi:MAG: pyridoxamine 5'-phosphate oxidase, partial [Alphaproteobacteria bacterium]